MACDRFALIAYALTGEELAVSATDIASLLSELAGLGWTAERVRQRAYRLWEQEQAWPYALPPGRLGSGAAQWYALLGQARAALGLDACQLPPSRRTDLTERERRLLDDVPPHHGAVG